MGTVAFIEVNLNSERAIKARVTKWLSIQIVALFRVLFWVFIIGGLSILIFWVFYWLVFDLFSSFAIYGLSMV